MVIQYCFRLKESKYKLKVNYHRAKRTPATGRRYARGSPGYCGQQSLPRQVRKFIQTGIYHDYDIIASWPSIMRHLALECRILCPELTNYVKTCQQDASHRDAFHEDNNITKHEILCFKAKGSFT